MQFGDPSLTLRMTEALTLARHSKSRKALSGTFHEPANARMWIPVTQLTTTYAANARRYRIAIEGQEREDGTWAGRLVFRDGVDVRVTDQETSQPDRAALEYWATGLEHVYLEGAFGRARMSEPD